MGILSNAALLSTCNTIAVALDQIIVAFNSVLSVVSLGNLLPSTLLANLCTSLFG